MKNRWDCNLFWTPRAIILKVETLDPEKTDNSHQRSEQAEKQGRSWSEP